jgi:hypothetical protein
VAQGLLIMDPSRSHSDTPHSVGLLWTGDQPDAETSTWQHKHCTRYRHPCPPAGFEPAIPVSQQLQTYALDLAATGVGGLNNNEFLEDTFEYFANKLQAGNFSFRS